MADLEGAMSTEPPTGKKKRGFSCCCVSISVIVLLVLVVGGGLGAFFAFNSGDNDEGEAAEVEKESSESEDKMPTSRAPDRPPDQDRQVPSFENGDKPESEATGRLVGANKDIVNEEITRVNRFYGLSYSPFGLGDNRLCPPYDDVGFQCLLSNQVIADMRLISTLTNRVKTYSLICEIGSDAILTYAAENGMTVMQGVWFSDNEKDNEDEFARFDRILEKHAKSGVITDVMLGNEAVFIVGAKVDALAAGARRVRSILEKHNASDIRIGTAEIFNVWTGEATDEAVEGSTSTDGVDIGPVVEEIDWIGLNTHPYYGGVDPSKGNAGKFVRKEQEFLEKKFNKPVIICETGYPTRGDPRTVGGSTAKPGKKGQELFAAQVEKESRKNDMPVYYFEPFDGDWKRRWQPFNELDYSFGLFNCDRSPKFDKLPEAGAL